MQFFLEKFTCFAENTGVAFMNMNFRLPQAAAILMP